MQLDVFGERSSGVLLHVTSLPGPFGAGDLGPEAHRFLEFLARSGQRWWQMLPVSPPGGGDSPYDSASAFAGSPWLVSLEVLRRNGLLEADELVAPRRLAAAPRAQHAASRRFRAKRLRLAFERFRVRPEASRELAMFAEENRDWLPDYALYQALHRVNGRLPWTRWSPDLRRRDPSALVRARADLADEVELEIFVQREFTHQWAALRERARGLGVRLLGDVPMFVAHDSADVWTHQDLFRLDHAGERTLLAGVPPDYFSADGQLWGNPIYDWDALRSSGYAWWVARLGRTLDRFDAVRLDHFIGFHRYWEVPAGARSARDGHFVDGPGQELFHVLKQRFGHLPFVAEDLGVLTDGVVKLRDAFNLPGMRVLAFAFAGTFRDYQPHRYPRRVVAYTGTHDNDTLAGWLGSHATESNPERKAELRAERDRALRYAGSDGREAHWDLTRTLHASVANTTIVPLQDLLGQDAGSRMNVPGTPSGNWRYRAPPSAFDPALAERLLSLSDAYERIPDGLRTGG
jgi:4-alpha-glucanotransferase